MYFELIFLLLASKVVIPLYKQFLTNKTAATAA